MENNKEQKQPNQKSSSSPTRHLILYNDDINTFGYIMESLIEVCEHDDLQAEQCTYLAHHKGKIDVKAGTTYYLGPMQEALLNRGIKASID